MESQPTTPATSVVPQKNNNISEIFKKNKIVIIGGVGILLLLLGSGGYFIVAGSQQSNTVSSPPTAVVEQLPSSIPTAIASISPALQVQSIASSAPVSSMSAEYKPVVHDNWNTFFSIYKYILQYPPDWTLFLMENSDPKIKEYAVLNPTDTNNYSITITYSLRTYAEQLALEPSGQVATIAGMLGTKTTVSNSEGASSVHYILPMDTSASHSSSLIFVAKSQHESTLREILDTFHFTFLH